MVTSCPALFSSHPAASPASPAPRIVIRWALPRRGTTFCGRAQLASEERDNPPAAKPASFRNSRRLIGMIEQNIIGARSFCQLGSVLIMNFGNFLAEGEMLVLVEAEVGRI